MSQLLAQGDVIDYPGVDLVAVTVKVPHHHTLISAALDAGKMVLSKWPLGVNLAPLLL
ncbi:MAG: hypothetical protein ACREXS_10255 [Gammaproteobacteria bacterium]